VARGALSTPNVALSARGRLIEDLGRAAARGRLGDVTPELAFEFAIGVVLQAMQAAAEGRFVRSQAPGVVAGILRAIGVKPKEAQEIALRVGASATNRSGIRLTRAQSEGKNCMAVTSSDSH
jgi:hypothetical protein